jgi:hypothetical protein
MNRFLINALICCINEDNFSYFINRMSSEDLYTSFCELQPNINENYLAKEKCLEIVKKINDEEILYKIIINTKNFEVINEALIKITRYSLLLLILSKKPELESHIKGRLIHLPNSPRFILDD